MSWTVPPTTIDKVKYDIRFSYSPITAQTWDDESTEKIDSQLFPAPSDIGTRQYVLLPNPETNAEERLFFAMKVGNGRGQWSQLSNVSYIQNP